MNLRVEHARALLHQSVIPGSDNGGGAATRHSLSLSSGCGAGYPPFAKVLLSAGGLEANTWTPPMSVRLLVLDELWRRHRGRSVIQFLRKSRS
jgi:hypothetical protein